MHSIKVLETARVEHLETASYMLELLIEVSRDGEVLHTRKLGFADHTPEAEVIEQLNTLRCDYDAQEAREAQIVEESAKAKSSLVGLEITAPTDAETTS